MSQPEQPGQAVLSGVTITARCEAVAARLKKKDKKKALVNRDSCSV